jgi:hypothetical protein
VRALGARGGLGALALAVALAPTARADSRLEVVTALESDNAWRVQSPRSLAKSQNRLELDTRLALSDALELRMTGRLLHDPVGALGGEDPGFRPVDRARVAGNPELEAELREAYLDWHGRVAGSRLDLRLGKQQIVWGQSFGLRVLDLANAQDFREFILDEFVDARTPALALRADATVRGFSLQAILAPDFEPDLWPEVESDFALDPEVPGLLPGLAPLPADPLLAGGGPLLALGDDRRPHDWRFRSLGFGLRAGRVVRGFDLALHYWDRVDPSPVTLRRISSLVVPGVGAVPLNLLETEYERVRTVGFSGSRPLGDFTLWTEGGVSWGRPYAVDDLSEPDGWVERNDLQYAVGLDWARGDWFVNGQWIAFTRFGPSHSIEHQRTRGFASLLVRATFLAETVIPQLFVLYGVDEREALLRPSIEWRVTDRLSLTVGADLFSGPRDGLLGQYAHERRCAPIPAVVPVPEAGTCGFDPPDGEPSRAFVRMRYAFEPLR